MAIEAKAVIIIVAMGHNRVIGLGGGLPWHVRTDLKRFKSLTFGKPIIMGRKTWQGLPRRPLPGRQNIILTRDQSFKEPDAEIVTNVQDALACAKGQEIYVIGGGEIFKVFLPLASRLCLSEIDVITEGDAYFPQINQTMWQEVSCQFYPQNVANGDEAAHIFRVFDRVSL